MESRYPGDIRPVMAACAALANKRASALAEVRKAVSELRDDVALGAMEMQQAGRERRAELGDLQRQLRRSLANSRQSREQQVESMRAQFARQRAETARSLHESLRSARAQIQREVAELKARTRTAQAARFKTGSFHASVASPVQQVVQVVTGTIQLAPKVIRTVVDIPTGASEAVSQTPKSTRTVAVDTRFLDTFGS
ncbi:MAG: hypothetical protein MUE46_13215 [Xanthomonadales bacterium]|jgi:chromosome segregation ATPase|nr:hypothetical protein [Xanthomonadales bacterium]